MTAKCLTWEASAAQRPCVCVCVCYIHLANRDQVKAKTDFSSITFKFNEEDSLFQQKNVRVNSPHEWNLCECTVSSVSIWTVCALLCFSTPPHWIYNHTIYMWLKCSHPIIFYLACHKVLGHVKSQWGQRMLRLIVRRGHRLSAESIATELKTSGDCQISSRTVWRQLHGIGFHGEQVDPSLTSPNAMQSVTCSGVKHAATRL